MHTAVETTHNTHEYRPREHPPQQGEREPTTQAHRTQVRRVGVLDRLALHLGVALIAWGRRPLTVETHERRAHRVEQHLAQQQRERDAERMHHITTLRL